MVLSFLKNFTHPLITSLADLPLNRASVKVFLCDELIFACMVALRVRFSIGAYYGRQHQRC